MKHVQKLITRSPYRAAHGKIKDATDEQEIIERTQEIERRMKIGAGIDRSVVRLKPPSRIETEGKGESGVKKVKMKGIEEKSTVAGHIGLDLDLLRCENHNYKVQGHVHIRYKGKHLAVYLESEKHPCSQDAITDFLSYTLKWLERIAPTTLLEQSDEAHRD